MVFSASRSSRCLEKLDGFEDHLRASRTSDDVILEGNAAMEDVIRVGLEFHYEDMSS